MKCPKCETDNTAGARFCQECAAPLTGTSGPGALVTETFETRREELSMGSAFAGRYQIIEELGHGGMGRVYRALDTKLHEEVGLKLIRPEIALDQKTLERFQNELKLARKISHRNVGRMYELMEDRGAHFITMEYVPGEDLRSFIRRSGQLTVGKTISVGKQVCDGLNEAHRQGIIHRDLKPSNIIIDREGNAKIMDFGIARSLATKSTTGLGVMIGTPEYMSPEQVEGKDVDPRSDLYSLGIILYEMATGRVPFEGDTPFTIGVKQKSERPKSPREFNAAIPEDLNRLILKCLEKDRSARPQSAAEVRAELERIEQGLPTTERVVPARKTHTARQVTVTFSLKKAIIPGAAVFIIIAAIVVWQLFSIKKSAVPPSGKPSLAIVYFENISGDPSLDDWKTGLPELLTTDLAQSKFLTVLSGETMFGILKKLNLTEAKKYSTEDLARVASDGRVGYVLSGGIMKAGSKIIITARLQKPRTGELVETKKIECAGEEDIPSKVDELTRMIKADLNLSPQQIAGDIDKAVGQITTTSPEALKYYVEARKRHMAMEYREAIPFYEKALALDPGFAMAYRGLATAYGNTSFAQKAREFNQKALANADRISDRERLLIQGRIFYMTERTYDKAIQTFEQLLTLYPDEYIALNGLGIVYDYLGEFGKALPYFERSYAVVKDALGCVNVASAQARLGRYDKAGEVYEDFLRTVSDSARIHVELGFLALAQSRFDEAMKEAEKAFLLTPGLIEASYLKSDVFYFQGNFEAAAKECRAVLERGAKAATLFARVRLIVLLTGQGRFADSARELSGLLAIADELKIANFRAASLLYSAMFDRSAGHPERAPDKLESAMKIFRDLDLWPNIRTTLAAQGLVFLDMGQPDKAASVAADLRAFVERGLNRKAVRHVDLLEGAIELKKGNSTKAVELSEKAVSFLPAQTEITDEHAQFLDHLAAAYEESGNLAKARETYEKITGLTLGRFMYGDIYAKAFFKLGRIAERQGDKAGARTNYRKFLEIWKSADPGIPEVSDAKRRLSGL